MTFEPRDTDEDDRFGVVDDGGNEPNETFSILLDLPAGVTDVTAADSIGGDSIDATGALSGSFESMPSDHDGSSSFGFYVTFTNDVGISESSMRDNAFTVTNGEVTGASKVNGRRDRWKITVEPDGNDAVRITLPGNRACTATGAICSDEDNPARSATARWRRSRRASRTSRASTPAPARRSRSGCGSARRST